MNQHDDKKIKFKDRFLELYENIRNTEKFDKFVHRNNTRYQWRNFINKIEKFNH